MVVRGSVVKCWSGNLEVLGLFDWFENVVGKKENIGNSDILTSCLPHGFDGNGGKFSKKVENTVEKGEIACYEKFLLFQQCVQ